MTNDRFNDYITTHPRESLRLLTIGIFAVWQTIPALLGILFYLILTKRFKLDWKILLPSGVMIFILSVLLEQSFHLDLLAYVHEGFIANLSLWKLLGSGKSTISFGEVCVFIFNAPFLLMGILSAIDLIADYPHHLAINALQKGINTNDITEISDHEVSLALAKLQDEVHDGTVLGISKYTGKSVVIPDRDINQVALVLGTTGSGKTITLRRFYKRAISKGYPLIIVDGKPDESNIEWLRALAEKYGRRFIGFNCGNYLSYDPLANGGHTELKDKIISLKDEWANDYYRSIAEDYLQTTFDVLLKSGKDFDMRTVVDCLNYDDLAILVRETKDAKLMKKVCSLEHYDRKDITGLQAHLNILLHSELGAYFEKNETTFTLPQAIQQSAVVYFALPALRFPSFSKVLGKLVINDLKAVIDRNSNGNQRIFTVFDEFSVFAGEQVLNLVNMGRGKGVHAIFGTQGLADLDKVDVTFKNQVLNCVNTLICHRLNDKDSAEGVANWVGTKDVFTVTAQLNFKRAAVVNDKTSSRYGCQFYWR
jgi:hypothetical protein